MKLTKCNWCSLHKYREHSSFSKGNPAAEVLIVFNCEPNSEDDQDKLHNFIRELNFYLKHDYYYSFAIKCKHNHKVKLKNVVACRKWLKREIDKVNPYLIILMGNMAKVAVLGKLANSVVDNVFYIPKSGVKERRIFVGPNVYGNQMALKESTEKLLTFIKEYYVAG